MRLQPPLFRCIRPRRAITALAGPGLLALLCLAPVQAGEMRPAPACDLTRLASGEPVDWGALRGQVLVVDFWASWCTPCARSFPFLNRLHQELAGQGLQILAINLDEHPDDAARFLRRHPAAFPILTDTTQACPQAFGVPGMPASYLIDRRGRVRYTHLGFQPGAAAVLRDTVEQLLREPAGEP